MHTGELSAARKAGRWEGDVPHGVSVMLAQKRGPHSSRSRQVNETLCFENTTRVPGPQAGFGYGDRAIP